MASVIPRDHRLWDLWMDPERRRVDSKCLMRMRMKDSYRDVGHVIAALRFSKLKYYRWFIVHTSI